MYITLMKKTITNILLGELHMKAVILAAGIGTRLQTITQGKPKCLIEVNGTPILEQQIDTIRKTRLIDEIIIIVGYRSKDIKDYVRDHIGDQDIRIIYNKMYQDTNNMYSLYLARNHVKEEFVLMNGDIVIEPEQFHEFLSSPFKDAIAVDVGNFNEGSMKVIKEGDYLTGISKSYGGDEIHGCSIDVYMFSKSGCTRLFSIIQEIIEMKQMLNQWTEIAIHEILESGEPKVKAFDIDGKKWMKIDDMTDLRNADTLFNDDIKKLIKKSVFFFDLDGTTFIENDLFDGVKDLMEMLKTQGKMFFFLSNNSSASTKDYLEKITRHGLDVDIENIILSQHPTFRYLKENGINRVFLLGTRSLRNEFEEHGFTITGEDPQAVVLAFDKELSYDRLVRATHLLQNGIPYFATHLDKKCPMKDGFIPDAGSIAALLFETTGRVPTSFGKPEKEMLLFKLKELKLSPKDAVMVGDRLYTDIQMGKDADVITICVLTGETTREAIEFSDVKPDIILEDISKLRDILF